MAKVFVGRKHRNIILRSFLLCVTSATAVTPIFDPAYLTMEFGCSPQQLSSTRPGFGDDLMFQCRTHGACIDVRGRCNGFPNCEDGSDELDCANVGGFVENHAPGSTCEGRGRPVESAKECRAAASQLHVGFAEVSLSDAPTGCFRCLGDGCLHGALQFNKHRLRHRTSSEECRLVCIDDWAATTVGNDALLQSRRLQGSEIEATSADSSGGTNGSSEAESTQSTQVSVAASTPSPTAYTLVGHGSCWDSNGTAAGGTKNLTMNGTAPSACYAACTQEYGDDCAGFVTGEGWCLLYTTDGNENNRIVTTRHCLVNRYWTNCDFWFEGTCYAVNPQALMDSEYSFYLASGCSDSAVPASSGFSPRHRNAGVTICCSLDGSFATRKINNTCISDQGVTYDEAASVCSTAGMRLCTNQTELDQACDTGCSANSRLAWTSIKAPTYYYLASACSRSDKSNYGHPRYAPRDVALGVVVCCSLDGGTATRKADSRCMHHINGNLLVTYDQAVATCAREGMRLCANQTELDLSCNSGCNYDGAAAWTSITALWPQYWTDQKKCTPGGDYQVEGQSECQELAVSKSHSFYQYCENCLDDVNWCNTMSSCDGPANTTKPWAIYMDVVPTPAPSLAPTEDTTPAPSFSPTEATASPTMPGTANNSQMPNVSLSPSSNGSGNVTPATNQSLNATGNANSSSGAAPPTSQPSNGGTASGNVSSPAERLPTVQPTVSPTSSATSAPTSKSTVKQSGEVVHLVVEGVDYDLLLGSSLRPAFESAVKHSLAAVLPEQVTAQHVSLVLSAGSVNIAALISPPGAISRSEIRSKLMAAQSSLGQSVTDGIKAITSIDSVTTAPISVVVTVPTPAPSPRPKPAPAPVPIVQVEHKGDEEVISMEVVYVAVAALALLLVFVVYKICSKICSRKSGQSQPTSQWVPPPPAPPVSQNTQGSSQSPARGDGSLQLDGTWIHKDDPDVREVIKKGAIQSHDGAAETRITKNGHNNFYVEMNGARVHVELVGNELRWEDGDVWMRTRTSVAPWPSASTAPATVYGAGQFDGSWRLQSDPEAKEVIRNNQIKSADGTLLALRVEGPTKFSVEAAGQCICAELVGEELHWDDGDVWIRVPHSSGEQGRAGGQSRGRGGRESGGGTREGGRSGRERRGGAEGGGGREQKAAVSVAF